jgi:hypothetical protein
LNLTGSLEGSKKNKSDRVNPTKKETSSMKTSNKLNSDQNSKQRVKRLGKLTPLLGVAGLALVSLSAQAQVFQYTAGDVIVDLSKTGSADLEVDAGNLLNQAAGTTVDLGGNALGQDKYTSAELGTVFGNAANALDGVVLTAVGTTSGTTADYFTEARSNPAQENTTPSNLSGSIRSTDHTQILGISSGITAWSANPTAGQLNSTTAVTIENGNTDGWTSKKSGLIGDIGAASENTTPVGFTQGDTAIVSDLFEYTGSGVQYIGDFTFQSDGELDFTTPSAVPEPSTYGLLGGFGLLLLALRKQFQSRIIA